MTDSGSIDGIGFMDKFNPVWAFQSVFVETDFESQSHEAMIEMLRSADPQRTRDLGEKLVKAATDMETIATTLSSRGNRVQWEGEGAESFRTWNKNMVSSTRRLASFSRTAGEAMKTAATTLTEVKRDMPPYPEAARLTLNNYIMQNPGGMAKLDQAPYLKDNSSPGGPSSQQAYDAKQQLENGHGEAVRQMRKLSTSYSLSNTTMNSAERPTFPPMPGELMPTRTWRRQGSTHIGASARPTATYPDRVSGGGVTTGGGQVGSSDGPTVGRAAPVGDIEMALDGGVAMPEAPTTPIQQQTGHGVPTSTTGPVTGPSVPGAPRQISRNVGNNQSKNGPTNKSGLRPPSIGSGGQTGSPTTRGGIRPPGAPSNTGIHGGRPVPGGPGQPTHGLPRSTAVGAEPAQNQQQRAPMGRPMSGGFGGAGGAGGSSSGVVGGRPLATTPGGRVGTSPTTPGVTGGRPFTPGGSGLARDGGESTRHGAMGRPASTPAPGEERRDEGERPDYLVEDEETWRSRREADVAPPVVD